MSNTPDESRGLSAEPSREGLGVPVLLTYLTIVVTGSLDAHRSYDPDGDALRFRRVTDHAELCTGDRPRRRIGPRMAGRSRQAQQNDIVAA